MITAPQINIITSAPSSTFSLPQGQAEGASTGSFMNVLAAMMADGGNNGGNMLSMFNSGNMSMKDVLQGLLSGNGSTNELDPLLLSFIQQLLAAPQQVQDLMSGIVTAADSRVQQLAQLNYGQFKDLAEFVKNIANNSQNNQPMTLEEIRAVIMDKFAMAMEVSASASQSQKQANTMTVSVPIEPIEVSGIKNDNLQLQEPLVQAHNTVVQESIKEIKAFDSSVAEKGILPTISDKKTDQQMNLLLNDKKTEQHIRLLNDKISGPNLSELIDDIGLTEGLNLTEVEIGSAATTAFNSEKDGLILNNQRVEAHTVAGNAQTQQITAPKDNQPVRETLHVNRLQEIDTKIIKAVESGQNSLTLRLEPPELGSVRIKLVLADGMVRADIRVDNSAVKEMLNVAMPQIRNSLENAGIKVSEFFVDIREEYYSDGRRQNHEHDEGKQQKQKRQEGEDFKSFDFFI